MSIIVDIPTGELGPSVGTAVGDNSGPCGALGDNEISS